MSAFTLTTHQWKPIGGGAAVVQGVIPYRCLSSQGNTRLFIQRGKAYTESGKLVDPLPGWAIDQLTAELERNPHAYDKVGGVAHLLKKKAAA